jgi:2,4-dichlorophenol 6-monooxygenase
VTRANRSSREFVQFFEVLGLLDAKDEDEMTAQIDERKADTSRGLAKRAALVSAMELKNYEFNAHGVELGQFYTSDAIVPDGSTRPTPTRDPELYYEVSTVPGSRLPHAWLGNAAHEKVSTLDLAPYSQFTLFTGIAGGAWVGPGQAVARDLGVALETVVVGPGQEYVDLYYDWARLREVEESGALLVRPDKHIAWRSTALPEDPLGALSAALSAVLGRAERR